MPTTPRANLPYPIGASPYLPGTQDIRVLAEAADAAYPPYDQGPFSARPTSTAGSPGIEGRLYLAVDQNTLYLDAGTSWLAVNPALVADGPAGTATLRTLGTGAQQAAAGNDARLSDQRTPLDASVTGAKVAATLKPSQGAGGGTEALRAIGSGAGQVLAGTAGAVGTASLAAAAVTAAKVGVMPGVQLTGSGTIAHNVETTLSFAEESDVDNMFVPGAPTIATIQTGGIWSIDAYLQWPTSPAGNLQLALLVSGAAFRYSSKSTGGGGVLVSTNELHVGPHRFGAGQTISLRALQTTGASLAGTTWRLSMGWISA